MTKGYHQTWSDVLPLSVLRKLRGFAMRHKASFQALRADLSRVDATSAYSFTCRGKLYSIEMDGYIHTGE